jgi:hypothetical protein
MSWAQGVATTRGPYNGGKASGNGLELLFARSYETRSERGNEMANYFDNHLRVIGLQENPEDLAKELELEMYGGAVPHESGNLFVEVVNDHFHYTTKSEPKVDPLIELSKRRENHDFLLSYAGFETQRNGQVVVRNGHVVESIDRIGHTGLFDDLEHPVIDIFAPYLRKRTLVQCADDRLQDSIGIVRGFIGILDDERFKNSPSTPYSDGRDQKQTEKVRADLAALLESMATQIGQLNFRGVLLEESELREKLLNHLKRAGDLIKALGVEPLVQEPESAVRFSILPFTAVVNKDPYLIILPVLHYVNADRTTGKYTKDAGCSFPPIEWEIRYVSLSPSEVAQIRKLPDADQTPLTCEGCGKELLGALSAGDNFCSDECREKVLREKAIIDLVQAHRAAIEVLGGFGIVTWSDRDIVAALERAGADVSPANVRSVREHLYVESIDDRMTEAGWAVIEEAISDLGLATGGASDGKGEK